MTDIRYYVIRNKIDGMYFRGKGVNRWGKYFNQATIYRIRGTAEASLREVAWRRNSGEDPEIVEVKIEIVEGIEIDPETEFFTPEQVRKMTSEQVHDNYTKIVKSMNKWS